MGRGKTDSDSNPAYADAVNSEVRNQTFKSKRMEYPENREDRKSVSFYSRYFRNSLKTITVTRNPLNVSVEQAKSKFLRLVKTYEEINSLKLREISKDELLDDFFNYSEKTNAINYIKDDAKQFLPYKILFPDVMKLYLYKMLYPRIFDFEIVSEENSLVFKSNYIENNFKTIYRQIEEMCLAIIYDSLLIAIEKTTVDYITSMKSYKFDVDAANDCKTLFEDCENEFKNSKDARTALLRKLKPSIAFLIKHHRNVYKSRRIKEKLLIFILKLDTFYAGKRADDSRVALEKTYKECSEILNDDALPFTRLLNLYYINKRSYLFDLNILTNNIEFMPYLLDGIVTKHHLNNIIIENNDLISKTVDNSLNLSSVYNNPNCILSNLSSRDYEILDYIISRTARTMKTYYLMDDGKDVPPSRICELIEFVDGNKLSPDISDIIAPFENFFTNNVDYERIMSYGIISFNSDGMPGLFKIFKNIIKLIQ